MALDPVSAVLDIGGKLIDRLWPNPAERAPCRAPQDNPKNAGSAPPAPRTEHMKEKI